MCGRFAVTTDPALLAQKIQAIDESASSTGDKDVAGGTPAANYSAGPNYNVAPTSTISSVVKRHSEPEDSSTRRVRSMRWGLIPPWVKTAEDGGPDTKGPLLINARADKVTSSPAFRNSAKNKRCLIPMDGWYEWKPNPGSDAKKAGSSKKTPYYMYGADGELLFMAGLWTTWRPAGAPKDAPPLLSCTIITTDAAGPLAEIHDRMPLTISAPDWDRWMDPDAPIDEGLLRGHGDLDRIAVREVSRLVNSVRNNGPELIEPAEPEEMGLF
ncbi:SOS response-associated peptidase [[Mycobacterium] fortunisiensis]|nr:SOS response-associated peptidase [[Mycobacterium] fortunisiensis]